MMYWLIQTLLFIAFILIGYSDSQSYRDMYGETATFVIYFLNALSFVLFSHVILRASTHYLRKKDKSIYTILLLALPMILVCALSTALVNNFSKQIFFPNEKKQAYFKKNPDELPQNQLSEVNKKLALINSNRADELKVIQDKLEKYKHLSDTEQKRKKENDIKGLKYGLEQRKRNLEDEIDALQAGDTDSSSLLNGLTLFLFTMWYVFYLFLSAIKNRFQIKTHLKQSQIALLMSQLNPHFLFNSLNSIRGMIFEDKQLAKELIDKLNELFEYNLTANKHASVKLKEELRICEFYLDIEHIRLEERLAIDMSIDGNCLNYKVPTMGLLTLIENAIKHGIAPRQEPSTLLVNIKKQSGHLIIDVSNPIFKGDYQVHSTGTGQENLLKRLQLMYADDASLETTLGDESYLATLRIPI